MQLLAPDLLDSYPRLRSVKRSIFHNFAAASQVPDAYPHESSTVIFVGAPWYLKGVDLLIRAFRNLEVDFPDARLQLLGHFPDRAPLDELVGDSSRIEILKARPNSEALKLISEAAILVLPSRCEGMGRVLIEAMSAGIPVIGSRIGGIPHLIRDGENGFLFPSGDADALEDRLRKLLADPDLRSRMGARGRELAKQQFTEARYAEDFAQMVHETVQGAK
ncbi:MAG: glycosyltransferase [Bryobacterales bacterium]|nr:glycosyltransferase [Bryobacterales bacterium]